MEKLIKTREFQEEIKKQRRELEIRINTENILDDIGIKISLKGYRFWITAVTLRIVNREYEKITQLYKDVAKKHKSTMSKVERALRNTHEDIENDIKKYFKIKYSISNNVFLECLTKKVELLMKQQELAKLGEKGVI